MSYPDGSDDAPPLRFVNPGTINSLDTPEMVCPWRRTDVRTTSTIGGHRARAADEVRSVVIELGPGVDG